ncbi:MAG: hypothetical protein A2W31_16950 [Planctomycetes bacterium RBG_16_64_10]|nr:MAG: hypothetical protein A2W31_16950 [Planctomycetes bacterium RBG_16_64_10]
MLWACWLACAPTSTGGADATPAAPAKIPRIAAAEARAHVSKTCAVELIVRSSRHLAGPRLWILNSCKNYRDPNNLAIVIWEDSRQAFKAHKILDPVQYYRGKKIRVTGRINLYQERPQIEVEKPTQIEILKPNDSKPEAAAEPAGPDAKPAPADP